MIPDFEAHLAASLKRHLDRGDVPPNLKESILYTMSNGGKRIRPRLAIASASLVNLPKKVSFAAAAAVEIAHNYTLIHDDLPCMDDDDTRRGRPANHIQFGENLALLAGDSLMALATDALLEASAYVRAEVVLLAVKRLNHALGPRGVLGGQATEIDINRTRDATLDQIQQMCAGKTGALFSAAALLPLSLAGVRERSKEWKSIERFGKNLGLAFQVLDDLDDEKDKENSPSNILNFMAPADAKKLVAEKLKTCGQEIDRVWGPRGQALNGLADELSSRVPQ